MKNHPVPTATAPAPTWRDRLLLQEDLNFLLTNRVPRIALTLSLIHISEPTRPY